MLPVRTRPILFWMLDGDGSGSKRFCAYANRVFRSWRESDDRGALVDFAYRDLITLHQRSHQDLRFQDRKRYLVDKKMELVLPLFVVCSGWNVYYSVTYRDCLLGFYQSWSV